MLTSTNPANGQTIQSYEEYTAVEIERCLASASKAFEEWKSLPFDDRARRMYKAAEVLTEGREEYAKHITTEMGMPIVLAKWEIDFCASFCRYYAENGNKYLESDTIESSGSQTSYITYQPLGPLLAVMPWNFPFAQVVRFSVPALMAGNVILLKHASNVTGCAIAIEKVFSLAGFPLGVFQALLINSAAVDTIISDRRICGVTVTGSEKAGIAIASQAGKALKKSVLELGGSDPFIVLDDADIEKVCREAVLGRTRNSGQSCISSKRFVIHEKVYDEFVKRFMELLKSVKIGDPMDESIEMGPLARFDLRDELHRQVTKSVENGAKCLIGGSPIEGPGAFYPPTILVNVKPGMPAYDEELFGPIASVMKVSNDEEAIRIANDTRFGLGASIWTRDVQRGELIASKIEAGMVNVNMRVSSDPRLPFGGIKSSGYGREGALQGIREFVNIKTIRICF